MKKMLFLLVVLFASCGQKNTSVNPIESIYRLPNNNRLTGKINISRYEKLNVLDIKSRLLVKLMTSEGNEVSNLSDLVPNTIYNISLRVSGVSTIELRSAFGFEVLRKKEREAGGHLEIEYTIKTLDDVTEPIFVSFLPLRSDGILKYREQAQNFFLPKI